MESIPRVSLPVRRVLARYVKTSKQFVPCEFTDARGTLLMTVDQAGRGVMAVHGDRGELGYQLAPGEGHDAPLFAAWIKAHPKITKEERRDV
jgi:hypothetical protein